MASTKEYLDFVMEQLSHLDSVSYRAMMGEYVLYLNGKVFGGIYDDRFLVKATPAARARLSQEELPYETAKPMLLCDCVDEPERLQELLTAMEPELPQPKRKR